MKRTIVALVLAVSGGLGLYACGGDDSAVNGGDQDASSGQNDSGPGSDGSFGGGDGSFNRDSGADGGLDPTSLQIQAAKNASPVSDAGEPDSGIAVSLPIDGATVTYVRPAVGTDPAGFFLQAEQTGPAIFVAIDPATLSPSPVPGDVVGMTVTAVTNIGGLHEIIAVGDFTRTAQGASLAALLRHVGTATDLVTKLDSYESEYIELDGFIASNFGGSAAGSVSAEITTAAVSSPATSLKIRLPIPVQQNFDLEETCSFTMTGVMWRFGKNAEPSAFANGDITATCGAPKVASAVAASATSALVVFDRNLGAITADGSQFTIVDAADAGVGVTVTAASLGADFRTVTLTTSTQTAGQPLKVTAAATVQDVLGTAVDPAHDSADFSGFVTPATVRLSEMNANISAGGQHDLIELQVLTDGNLVGITLQENLVGSKVLLATLPNLQVVAGDLVVVHLQADFPDGGVNLITNETTTKGDCTLPACYANAWDVSDVGHGQKGMVYGSRVITAQTPSGSIMDGISWYSSGGTPLANFSQETNALIDAGLWETCDGGYCDSLDAALAISFNMNTSSTSPTGRDVQRVTDIATNTHSRADWELNDAGSFGVINTP